MNRSTTLQRVNRRTGSDEIQSTPDMAGRAPEMAGRKPVPQQVEANSKAGERKCCQVSLTYRERRRARGGAEDEGDDAELGTKAEEFEGADGWEE